MCSGVYLRTYFECKGVLLLFVCVVFQVSDSQGRQRARPDDVHPAGETGLRAAAV